MKINTMFSDCFYQVENIFAKIDCAAHIKISSKGIDWIKENPHLSAELIDGLSSEENDEQADNCDRSAVSIKLNFSKNFRSSKPVLLEKDFSGFLKNAKFDTKIYVAGGAKVKIVELVNYCGDDLVIFSNTDLQVGNNASVDRVLWHNTKCEARHTDAVIVGENAYCNNVTINTGEGKDYYYQQGFKLDGIASEVSPHGLFFGKRDQNVRARVNVEHFSSHTKSDVLYKNVLWDRSNGFFEGFSEVNESANDSKVKQKNLNVLMSDEARAFAVPSLSVNNKNVQCSHGTTVKKLNEEALFYLLSRGIEEEDAHALFLTGFVEDVLSLLPAAISDFVKNRYNLHAY